MKEIISADRTTERIQLAGNSCIKVAFLILSVIILSCVTVQYFIFSRLGVGLPLFVVSGAFAILIFSAARTFWTSVATAYIRGEMVIVKYVSGASKITELRVMRTESNFNFFGIRLTRLKFRIDGRYSRVLILHIGNQNDPGQIIQSVQHAA